MRGFFGIVVAGGLVVACGGSDGSADASGGGGGTTGGDGGGGSTGESGGTSGSTGAASGSGGAAGGSSGTAGKGGTGGSTGGTRGSAGKGGSAGDGGKAGSGGSGGDVLDPDLPDPGYDCRPDTAHNTCISVTGTLLGAALDTHCAREGGSTLVTSDPAAWPFQCAESELGPTVGYWYSVSVPPQEEGTFRYELAPGADFTGAAIGLASDDTGGSSLADHFEGGIIEGEATYDAEIDGTVITGTFRGRWGTPAAGCDAGSPSTCGAAEVHGTFRLLHLPLG
jgi:hypothetical protein